MAVKASKTNQGDASIDGHSLWLRVGWRYERETKEIRKREVRRSEKKGWKEMKRMKRHEKKGGKERKTTEWDVVRIEISTSTRYDRYHMIGG